MKKPPPNRTRIRLTIDVKPEVYEAYRALSELSGLGIGRCMGNWLYESLEASKHMTRVLAEMKARPAQAARTIASMSSALSVVSDALLADAAELAGAGAARAQRGTATPRPERYPPSCNTGGNQGRKGKS